MGPPAASLTSFPFAPPFSDCEINCTDQHFSRRPCRRPDMKTTELRKDRSSSRLKGGPPQERESSPSLFPTCPSSRPLSLSASRRPCPSPFPSHSSLCTPVRCQRVSRRPFV